MTNTKTTKRALLASVLSVVMCISMLIGSTFAWFTDTASTAVNSIQSGTIDIRLTDLDGKDMEGKTLKWVDAKGNSDILWEPGCTFITEPVRLWNYSNLSIALHTSVAGFTGDLKLLEAIEYKIAPYDEVYNEDGTMKEYDDIMVSYLAQFTEAYGGFPMSSWQYGMKDGQPTLLEDVCIVAHMKEDAGNEYQGLTLTGAALYFRAAQYAYEKDAYDDRYDADADYDEIATNQDELNGAVANATEPTTVVLPAGDYNVPAMTDKDVTFKGDKDTVVNVNSGVTANGSTITFEGITVSGVADESSFYTTQLNGAEKVIYKNCTITGLISTYCDSEFIDCTFENTFNDQYSVFCYGGNEFKFENCTFNTNCSKAIKLYNEGATAKTLTVTDCTFKTTTADKAAIEIDSTYATERYTVNISGCTTTGSYTKLWNDKSTNSVVTVK